jgi:ATP-dependent Clp protease ATP-binding subunit ClpA
LRDAFAPETPPVRHSAESLTDLDAIRAAASELSKAIFVDEDDLLRQLTNVVIGQPTALQALASCVARHCARSHPTRPAVVFAVGPSGVGKTRSAEELADAIAAAGDVKEAYGYLRLDMNEYQEAYRISQLLGSPQGYVGHSEGSQLLDALSSNPRTIILFDEIEKAHPAVLRSLMNAMDAGRISAASKVQGQREIDCSRAIFFFTSNLESRAILEELQQRDSFGDRSIEDDVCRRRLRAAGIAPEIVGRIGRFLVFRDLTPEVRAEIVTHAIAEIAGEYGLTITRVAPTVVIDLLKQSRSEDFGVRPERSLIDDLLGGAFAAAARQGLRGSLTISGPPYVCTIVEAVKDHSSSASADSSRITRQSSFQT